MNLAIELPSKIKGLFDPHRYKVLYGGRGSGKSWGIAIALLLIGAQRQLRVLCAREVQKSIRKSVHQLLTDQINRLNLGQVYTVQETVIRGINGSTFNFSGLAEHTVDSIKSYEGVDICWVEEAQTVSERSWRILLPTIRAPGSEVWVSFNPDLDTDPVFQRFIVDPPKDALVVKINYSDNPWFPEVLEQQRLEDQRRLPPEEYANIWDGVCRSSVSGAIFAQEMRIALEQHRVTDVPYDPRLKVHVVVDLGWNDSTFILLVQRDASAIRILRAIEDSQRPLDSYSAELRELRMNWGKMWLPHDGWATSISASGITPAQIMRKLGWDVDRVEEVGLENGIKLARMTFPRVWMDRVHTMPLQNALKRYRRAIPTSTGEPARPIHDQASHGADAFRYMCVVADKMRNEDEFRPPRIPAYKPADAGIGY